MTQFEPNQSYNVRVSSANVIESPNTGTPGIQITFEKEDGATIQHTLWVTPKNAEYVAKDLATLGVDSSKLSSPSFMDSIGSALQAQECNITTFEEEFNGKFRLKVQYINKKRDTTGALPAHRIAELFGGPKAYAPEPVSYEFPTDKNGVAEIPDEEIPF